MLTLTHFQPMYYFYTPENSLCPYIYTSIPPETFGFLMFSGGIGIKHWLEMS